MKTSLDYHIHRLWQHHGSYTKVARAVGIDPRSFRRGRNGQMARPAERLLITNGRLLALRQLIQELVRSGALKPADINNAWRKVRSL